LPRKARGELRGEVPRASSGQFERLDHPAGAGHARRRRRGGVGAQADGLETAERDAVLGGERVEILDRQARLEEQRGDRAVGSRGDVRRKEAARIRAEALVPAEKRDALVARIDPQRGLRDRAADERSHGPRKFDFKRQPRGHLVAHGRAYRADGAVGKRLRHGAPDRASEHQLAVGRVHIGRDAGERGVARTNEPAVEAQEHADGGGALETHPCPGRVL